MRLRYDCSLEEIAHFTTTVEHIVFALCVTILAVTLCHFQSPYLQYWLWQGAAQVPTPAPAEVPIAKGRNRAGRRGGWAQRQFRLSRDNPLGVYLRGQAAGGGRGRGQAPARGQSGRRADPLPEIHLLRRASGRLIHLGSVTAQQALSAQQALRTPRDRPPLNPPTRFTVLGDSRVPTELSTPPPGWSLGGTGAIGLQPTPPLPAPSSARSTRLFPAPVSRLSRPSEWLSAHPGWRIPTSQGTSGWD